jgi:hypothetical protein
MIAQPNGVLQHLPKNAPSTPKCHVSPKGNAEDERFADKVGLPGLAIL